MESDKCDRTNGIGGDLTNDYMSLVKIELKVRDIALNPEGNLVQLR